MPLFHLWARTRARQPSRSWRQRATVGKENTAYYYFPPVQSAYACPTACLPACPQNAVCFWLCVIIPELASSISDSQESFFSLNLAAVQKELHCSLSKPLLIALMAAPSTQRSSCSTCYMEFFFFFLLVIIISKLYVAHIMETLFSVLCTCQKDIHSTVPPHQALLILKAPSSMMMTHYHYKLKLPLFCQELLFLLGNPRRQGYKCVILSNVYLTVLICNVCTLFKFYNTCRPYLTTRPCVFTFLYQFLLLTPNYYKQSHIMGTITLINGDRSAIKELSWKVNPNYFPQQRRSRRLCARRITGGLTWYKVVESRDGEHGVFVLSVVHDSYSGRICENRISLEHEENAFGNETW